MAGSGFSSFLIFCCVRHRKLDKGKGRQQEEQIRLPERRRFDELTLLTDEERSNPSRWTGSVYVGLRDPHPDIGLRKEPLELTELELMSDDERRQNIVRRANYYLQISPGPGGLSLGALNAHHDAQNQGPFSGEKKDPALALSVG
jgi:hypothetical protein